MRLFVDGALVTVEYDLFKKRGAGAAFRLLVEGSAAGQSLHRALVAEFKRHFVGLMDSDQPDAEGVSEIRFLSATSLEAIDVMRFYGHGVREVLPNSK